jgi:N-acetylmuramoyl-L-alanine amidase
MKTHTIQQGECVMSVSFENGFFWETVWNHPQNESLRAKRRAPNIVLPGDEVFIPDARSKEVPAATGMRHRFRRRGVPAALQLRLTDQEGEPRAGVRYRIAVEGREFTGVTDAQGSILCPAPPNASRCTLTLNPGENEEEEIPVLLRHLDPVDTPSGVQARLRNLGVYEGTISGLLDEATEEAVALFQAGVRLPVTGKVDDATSQALVEAHGS